MDNAKGVAVTPDGQYALVAGKESDSLAVVELKGLRWCVEEVFNANKTFSISYLTKFL